MGIIFDNGLRIGINNGGGTSPTPTPSSTPNISSPTPTPTPTPTGTPAGTPSTSNTPTPSVTRTNTPTSTPTGTPAGTPSASNTPTPTLTPTMTMTPTASSSSASAPMVVTISEVGSNVVVSASGTVDLTGLTLVDPNLGPIGGGGIGINTATFICGNNGSYASTYSGFTSVPSNFGSGSGAAPSSASGNYFGVIMNGQPPYLLLVPTGYTSGTNISSTVTFTGQTLTTLGLTNGTYTYTWSGGSIDVVIGGPAPTPTPTPSTGAVGACSGVGSWYFYSDEGTINAGPPIANGNAIFTINGGGPVTETFNPNKTDGTTNIYFDVKDSTGTDYTSQFNSYVSGGYTGTISICQNGNTARYVGQGIPGSFGVQNGGGNQFFIMNLAMLTQTLSSATKFNNTDPIVIKFGS